MVDDGETYVLGRDPETVSIKDILDCVKNSGKKAKAPEDRSPEEDEIDDLLGSVDLCVTKALEGKSLQSLIRARRRRIRSIRRTLTAHSEPAAKSHAQRAKLSSQIFSPALSPNALNAKALEYPQLRLT